MTTAYKKIIDQLEEILEKNRDAEKGYKKAAEITKNTNFQTFFKQKSDERKQFATALNRELILHYNAIRARGSFSGNVHRRWMDFKTLFSGNIDKTILKEVAKGDEAAIIEYTEVLEDDLLPESIAILIREQLIKIRGEINHIRTIEDVE